MNEQNLNLNQTPVPTNEPMTNPQSQGRFDPVKELVKNLYLKISTFVYPKRKIFLLIFGVLFFMLLVGIILSNFRNKADTVIQPSPTPQATSAAKTLETSDVALKLKTLKEKVFSLDVYQKHLSPPLFDFKISF